MPRHIPTATVVVLELDEPLRPLAVDARHDRVVLVVRLGRRVVAQVELQTGGASTVDVPGDPLLEQVAEDAWRAELERLFLAAVGADRHVAADPAVTVVVCTRDRPDDLQRCLESIGDLDPAPHEVIVVDSAPTSAAARGVADRFGASYLLEPAPGQSRARNRGIVEAGGDVVAFTDDDCVVDRAWLADLGTELADPRVAAVTGIVAPLELRTPSQWLFEAHGGHRRGFRRLVADGAYVNAIMTVGRLGVGANVAFRRSVFERVGLFREWLGPGTPARAADDYDVFCRILAAGDRIVYDPARLVWHRHRTGLPALRRTLRDYGCSSSALATQRILGDGDLGALRVFQWWWLEHVPGDVGDMLRRAEKRVPLRMTLGELAGTLAGPAALARSRYSRRSIRPVELPVARPPDRGAVRGLEGASTPMSVVVASVGRAASLERLMRALAAQTHPAPSTEVVVVLDGGGDDSASRLRALEVPFRLVVEELERVGVGAARNAGATTATGELVVFLDDDVVPAPNCLAAHAAAHVADELEIVLGYAPPVVSGDWWSLVVRAWWEDHFHHKSSRGVLRWNDVVTLNSSFRASVLADLGGFDATFARRHEDWELGIRALGRGLRARYEPRAVARHHLDDTLAGAIRRQQEEAQADVQLARLYPSIGRELALAHYLGDTAHRSDVAGDEQAALARATRLERRGRKGAWRNLTSALMRDAYVAGLREALPTDAEYRAFVAAVDAVAPTTVTVALDGDAPPHVPPVGAVELCLTLEGNEVCRIQPGQPGDSWSWRTALERLNRNPPPSARAAILERLERGVRERSTELAGVD